MIKFLKKLFVVLLILTFTYRYITDRFTSTSTSLEGPYKVIHVIDGDTLLLNINEQQQKVRMIGIDTPESVHADQSKNTPEGILASNFTKSLLEGQKVYLEYDQSKKDQYNRILAYIYLKDDTGYLFVNNYIIESGYAYPMTIEPNNKYANLFLKSFEKARKEKKGLWKD